MQKYANKICKIYVKYMQKNIRVYVFAYGAYICTPHFADHAAHAPAHSVTHQSSVAMSAILRLEPGAGQRRRRAHWHSTPLPCLEKCNSGLKLTHWQHSWLAGLGALLPWQLASEPLDLICKPNRYNIVQKVVQPAQTVQYC